MKDKKELTAPCGLDCFNCEFYLAKSDEEAAQKVKKLSAQFFQAFKERVEG